MAPNSTAAAAATFRRTIKSIDVVDDLTLRVNTVTPQIGLPASLTRAVAPEGAVMPNAYIERLAEGENSCVSGGLRRPAAGRLPPGSRVGPQR